MMSENINSRWTVDFPERLARVTEFAARHFLNEKRKGTEIPYMSHLMAVAAGVYELGGGPDEVLAALLHDVLEDQDVDPSEIEALAGPEVARIVIECSDSLKKNGPKAPWKERKLAALENIKNLDPPSLRVVLADKLHNSRCIVRDLRIVGSETLWNRFSAGREEIIWYYNNLAAIFALHPDLKITPEAQELQRNAETMTQELERSGKNK